MIAFRSSFVIKSALFPLVILCLSGACGQVKNIENVEKLENVEIKSTFSKFSTFSVFFTWHIYADKKHFQHFGLCIQRSLDTNQIILFPLKNSIIYLVETMM